MTLSNIKLELNCLGKLKLIDRAPPLKLTSDQSESIRLTVKAGKIFGSISYEIETSSEIDQRFLPRAVLTVSSVDYMELSNINLSNFKKKWNEFELEKKNNDTQFLRLF